MSSRCSNYFCAQSTSISLADRKGNPNIKGGLRECIKQVNYCCMLLICTCSVMLPNKGFFLPFPKITEQLHGWKRSSRCNALTKLCCIKLLVAPVSIKLYKCLPKTITFKYKLLRSLKPLQDAVPCLYRNQYHNPQSYISSISLFLFNTSHAQPNSSPLSKYPSVSNIAVVGGRLSSYA